MSTSRRRRLLRILLAGGLLLAAGELGARLIATPGYGQPITRPHATLGWELLPGVRTRHRREEFDVAVCVDAAGLRTSAAGASGPPGAGRSLAVLGDSFSFGQGVEFGERFSERLPGWQVSNFGVPAYGTDQELLQYELVRPAADVVLLAYFVDNVVRNGSDTRDGRPKPCFELTGSAAEDGGLRLRNVPLPAAIEAPPAPRRLLWEHSRLYRELRRQLYPRVQRAPSANPYPEYTNGAPAWAVTRALIARLARSAPRFGVMLIPEAWQIEPGADEACQRAVEACCAELGVPLLDLTPALRAARVQGPLYFTIDGHWTPAGHAAAAAALRPFLETL